VLTVDERAWIMDRITEIRDKIAGLEWPLGMVPERLLAGS
jgi:hypothetical protein